MLGDDFASGLGPPRPDFKEALRAHLREWPLAAYEIKNSSEDLYDRVIDIICDQLREEKLPH